MRKKDPLGQWEQLILTAVAQLREEAFGLAIVSKVQQLSGREDVSTGAVYQTLDRMEEKGYVKSWLAKPTPERGNRPRRYFRLLVAGEKVLAESSEISRRLADAIDESLETGRWAPDKI